MSRTFAVVMVVAILLCLAGTRKEIPYLRDTQERAKIGLSTLFSEMWAVLGNPSFRAVFFRLVLGSVVGGVESAFNPYMGIHFWGFRTEERATRDRAQVRIAHCCNQVVAGNRYPLHAAEFELGCFTH